MNEKRLPNEQEGVENKDQGMGQPKDIPKEQKQGPEKIGQEKPSGGNRDINR